MEAPVRPTLAKFDEWTVADVEALDVPEWWRYEILDGSLIVSPSAGNNHERVSALVRDAVRDALPPAMMIVGPLGLTIGSSYLIPDLLVVGEDRLRDATRLQPGEVALAVEVVSPGSVSMDRLVKPAKYATAGIAGFWRVETDPVSLTAYVLDGEVYREVGSWASGQSAVLDAPFPITVKLDRLR